MKKYWREILIFVVVFILAISGLFIVYKKINHIDQNIGDIVDILEAWGLDE